VFKIRVKSDQVQAALAQEMTAQQLGNQARSTW
jgi:hypothetical protein